MNPLVLVLLVAVPGYALFIGSVLGVVAPHPFTAVTIGVAAAAFPVLAVLAYVLVRKWILSYVLFVPEWVIVGMAAALGAGRWFA